MSSPFSPPPSPDIPAGIAGFHYVCFVRADSTCSFRAPANDVEQILEISAQEIERELSERQFPARPNAAAQFWESFQAHALDMRPWFRDFRCIGSRSGRDIWVRACGVPQRDGDAGVRWEGVVLDVTDLKSQELELRAVVEKLAKSEAWMRAALDGAKMLGWALDLKSNRWETTDDIPNFYGVRRGLDYSDPEVALTAVHPDDIAHVLEGRRKAIATGELMQYEFRGRIPASDGLPRWYSTRGQVMLDASGNPSKLVAVTADITEKKRAEAERESLNRQLLETQKWESLGVLAGGVAHDFNNILTVVLGSAGLARKGLPPSSPAGPYLEQIEQACRRAADLCRQLLAYSGRGQVVTGKTDLNELIENSSALLSIPASKAVRIEFGLANDLPSIAAEASQVRQVVVNLIVNAAEAIGDAEGKISVTTALVEVPAESLAGFHLAPSAGTYVRLAVADSGPGIARDVLDRIFDPFFTTRFPGRGLGLAAVIGIVRAHRGAIGVKTDPTLGTTFEVLWPVQAAPATRSKIEARPAARSIARKALVVDDEMFVRELMASALQELDYEPLLAGDGPTALEQFRNHRERVCLAVIDVVMPGMMGDQLLQELHALAPTLPVVLVSGYTDRRDLSVASSETVQFLQKPFHPEELIALVKRVTNSS